MKNILWGFVMLLTVCSCDSDDNAIDTVDVIGQWKLIEVYNDPGDGSGDFEAVTSNKTIKFNSDGTLTANGELCVLTTEANAMVNGTYSLEDLSIETPNCLQLTFVPSTTELIIVIPCDEPCLAKYSKI